MRIKRPGWYQRRFCGIPAAALAAREPRTTICPSVAHAGVWGAQALAHGHLPRPIVPAMTCIIRVVALP